MLLGSLTLVQSWNLITKVRAVQADLMKPPRGEVPAPFTLRRRGGRKERAAEEESYSD